MTRRKSNEIARLRAEVAEKERQRHANEVSMMRYQDEVTRLTVEVERLQGEIANLVRFGDPLAEMRAHLEEAEAERDEALARLANCGQENCMGWKLKDHTNWVTEDRYKEALAQVAVLLKRFRWLIENRLRPNVNVWGVDEQQRRRESILREINEITRSVSGEARALLGRLRRLEEHHKDCGVKA